MSTADARRFPDSASRNGMFDALDRFPKDGKPDGQPRRFLLWIDGVGAYLLCLSERMTIGGPASEGVPADLSLMAGLSRQHATILRGAEGYLLEAHCPTRVGGRDVHERAHLNDQYEIELAGRVRLRFRLPTVLSGSARLEFVSDHRPAQRLDGVVLMDDTCLLGPGGENHVTCPDWPGSIVLFRRDGGLWVKSRLDVFVGTQHAAAGARVNSGDIVTGPELRFRLEAAS